MRNAKMNWYARFVLSLIIVTTFIFWFKLLFYAELPNDREIWLITVGAYVAVLTKSTDYWFKDKDDPEHKESQDLKKTQNKLDTFVNNDIIWLK